MTNAKCSIYMQNESQTKWKQMLCYIFIFCIAGTLGNNQLPALVNNKQHKPSSRPLRLLSGQHHFFLFFSFFKLLLIFLKPLVNHFDTAEKCWALQSKVIEDVLSFKRKKSRNSLGGKTRTKQRTYIFDCAKHRTIKRYIYIQQTILCKHGKYVSFQKTWSYHKYRQHWHRQTSRNEHSGLLRCSPKPQKPTESGLKNNQKKKIHPNPTITIY